LTEALNTRIEAIRAYVPETVVPNEEFERRFDLEPGTIEAKTGLRSRRRADPSEHPTAMGLAAIRATLDAAEVDPEDLDLIISASASRDQAIPTDAIIYAHELGVAGVQCLHMEVICQSFVNALEIADLYIRAGRHRRVLIVTAEQPSRVIDPDDYASSILLGDGAAAALLTGSSGDSRIEASRVRTQAVGRNIEVGTLQAGGVRHIFDDPDFTSDMRYFHVDGALELRLASRYLPALLEELFLEADCTYDDITHVIPHQVVPSMVRALLARLGLAEQKVHINPEYGNQAAASIPIGLADLVTGGRVARGDRVMLIGGAAGFSIGGVVLRY
jgi:3-oxoacyl-[acyl-carrier-protein] synthase III